MIEWPETSDDYVSASHFRRCKRKEVREAIKALDQLRLGCAFLPDNAYRNVLNAANALDQVKKLISVRKWKR